MTGRAAPRDHPAAARIADQPGKRAADPRHEIRWKGRWGRVGYSSPAIASGQAATVC